MMGWSDCPDCKGSGEIRLFTSVALCKRERDAEDFQTYYVHRHIGGAAPWHRGGAVFVKEAALFEAQGGLREPWGKAWTKVQARSIEAARAMGEAVLPA